MEEKKSYNRLIKIEEEVRGRAEKVEKMEEVEKVKPPKKEEKKSIFWRRNLKEVK